MTSFWYTVLLYPQSCVLRWLIMFLRKLCNFHPYITRKDECFSYFYLCPILMSYMCGFILSFELLTVCILHRIIFNCSFDNVTQCLHTLWYESLTISFLIHTVITVCCCISLILQDTTVIQKMTLLCSAASKLNGWFGVCCKGEGWSLAYGSQFEQLLCLVGEEGYKEKCTCHAK